MKESIIVGVLKVGCIGTLPLFEFLLDERAERSDIDVRVIGSGAKLEPQQCREATELMIRQKPDLVIFIGPAQIAPGPKEARKILESAGVPTIVISDSPGKKVVKEMEEAGFGYVIVEADSMIGARREFLDPAEMALYNSDVIKVLAATGVFNLIIEEIENVIKSVKTNEKLTLPRLIINEERAIEAAEFLNPYAKAKATGAYKLACQVSKVTSEACFKISDHKIYIPLVSTAHEMMRSAARLANEAREIEKSRDSVLRKPHFKDGTLGKKRGLMEKPRRN